MLISVIIPIYNGEKYLRECLDSVKACPLGDEAMECIMINDGSSDGTEGICKVFVKNDPRFRLVTQDNFGVSEARNRGISEAKGTYIFFVDADDYVAGKAWAQIVSHAYENKYDMVAYAYYNLFDGGRKTDEKFSEGCGVKLTLLSTTLLNACWGKLFRREIIKNNGISFREELKTCEDAVFNIDFVENAENFLLCNTSAVYYRIHAASVMQNTSFLSKVSDFAVLFDRRKRYLEANYDKVSECGMYRQNFSAVTDLLRSYARNRSIQEISATYQNIIKNPPVSVIFAETKREYLLPFRKKLEYMMLRKGYYTLMAIYFKIKGGLT